MFKRSAAAVLGIVLGALGCLCASPIPLEAQQDPINPNASQKTRDVLKLLYDLPTRPDQRVLSGQVLHVFEKPMEFINGQLISTGPVAADVNKRISDIYNKFGIWVAIVGAEYTDWGNFTPVSKIMSAELNPSLIAHSNRGGIVELHFHPVSPRNGAQWDSGITASLLLDQAGPIHDNYFTVLDAAAAGLQELRDNNVVVLWKPIHGRDSGGGFWWGQDVMSQADYNRVWAHMVDYFSNVKGLNNLLWMQDFYYGGRWGDITQLYVGGSLVDLVGYDSSASSGELYDWEYANLTSFGKPIGISQNYPYAIDDYTPGDMQQQIVDIRNRAPLIVFNINFDNDHVKDHWNMDWSIAGNLSGDKLLGDSWTLNAPIFPPSSSGPPTITSQPADQTVTEGQAATFSVGATGTAPLSYQWQMNGTDIPGATRASYTTPATTLSDSGGTFRVVVTNVAGSATSNLATLTVNPSGGSLPPPWLDADIGAPGVAGSASYSGGVFTVAGSGTDIGGMYSQIHFVYQSLTGDGEIVARVASVQNTDPWAQAGVAIFESLAGTSTFADVMISSGNGAVVEYRPTAGGGTLWDQVVNITAPYWVKLARSGDTFSRYISADGASWTQVGSPITISMAPSVFVGLAVTAIDNTVLNTSIFDSVSLTMSNPPGVSAATTTASGGGGGCGTLGMEYILLWGFSSLLRRRGRNRD